MSSKSESPNIRLVASVELFERLKGAEYGSFMSYEELSAIVPDPQGKGRSHILKVRRRLSKLGKLLLCKTGKGYYIGKPEEHIPWARAQNEASRRKVGRALEAIVYVPFELLTQEQRELAIQEQLRIGLPYAMGHQLEQIETLTVETKIKMPTGEQLLEVLRAKKQIE